MGTHVGRTYGYAKQQAVVPATLRFLIKLYFIIYIQAGSHIAGPVEGQRLAVHQIDGGDFQPFGL